jgi:hypothetical protein
VFQITSKEMYEKTADDLLWRLEAPAALWCIAAKSTHTGLKQEAKNKKDKRSFYPLPT